MKEKLLPKKIYDRFVKSFPTLSVDAIIKDSRGILLIHRKIEPYKGYWIIPGGSVMFKERLKKAVAREVREETGLKIKVIRYLGYYDDPSRVPEKNVINHSFICKIIGGKIKPNFESSEVRFFKKLPKKIGFDHRKILRDAGVK